MKEADRDIQGMISNSLTREIQPWLKIAGVDETPNGNEIFSQVSVALLSLARRTGLSVEKVEENLPKFLRIPHNGSSPTELQLTVRDGSVPMKKTIRESVVEPPIRGVHNGGKRFDEGKFRRLLQQKEKQRKEVLFTPVDINRAIELRRKKGREVKKTRLAMRWAGKNLEKDAPTRLDTFMPESIEFTERDIHQTKMEKIDFSFDDVLSFATLEDLGPRICEGTIHDRIGALLKSMSTKRSNAAIANRILEMTKREGHVRFGTMCLPCLNPNPFMTDHPSIAVNAPTVLFLERMNSFARELERVVDVPVRFFLARELDHMSSIFPLSPDDIQRGIKDLESVLTKRNLSHVQICDFPVSSGLRSDVRPRDATKFFLAFKRSQVNFELDPVTHLRWLGIIDGVIAKKVARKRGVDLESQLRHASSMEELARRQTTQWASIRESPWKESTHFLGSIIVSIRPGSQNFTIVPISRNSSENFPMLPQHCSVGIAENRQLVTMKRSEFLLHPFRWLEVKTEHGAVFIHRKLL